MPYWTLHGIFHLDSQYVIDLLSGVSLPSTNLELTLLLLDYFHYLQSNSYVELCKVKSHTGITGNDRADSNAAKGVTSRSPIGRFSSFPPSPLPSLPLSTPPSLPPDATTFNLIQTMSTHADNCFPSKPPDRQLQLPLHYNYNYNYIALHYANYSTLHYSCNYHGNYNDNYGYNNNSNNNNYYYYCYYFTAATTTTLLLYYYYCYCYCYYYYYDY